MKKVGGILLIVFSCLYCNGQIRVNNPVDPGDTELNSAVSFFTAYLNEFSADRLYLPDFSKYWPAEDCREYKIPDQLCYAINTSIPTYLLGKPTILYAKPESDYIHIKTLFSRTDSAGNLMVLSITNHYLKHYANGLFFFVNPMKLASPDWRTSFIRNITYHYPYYHHFDKRKANEIAGKIEALEQEWNLKPIGIRYFFADTKEEIEHYRGFDFTIAMGNRNKPTGMSDGIDNIIYCGGWGENYFHEVVHIYLNKLFPKSPLTEGLAVFYGGSLGHDLNWHIKRLATYLGEHPEINLNNPEDFYYLDNFTNPLSTIHGLLCANAYQKDKVAGLKRIMSYLTLDDLFSNEYKVEKGEWNTLLRKLVADAARQE